jgi:exodeoxyribonuclease VII large subunit
LPVVAAHNERMRPVPAPLTISALTENIRSLLERGFADVTVVGEITSLSRPASGHLYLSLRDRNACLRCVVWRMTAERLRGLPLSDGLEVVARGRIAVYAPRGDYQLQIDDLVPVGAGLKDQALRRLKEKLQKLGYFAAERKKPLPRFPAKIALVTSSRGAAVRDMLEVLARRWPLAKILVCPVRVQGDEAPPEIAAMLDYLSLSRIVDVVLLGRGGGSGDDLAAFNDERVAHAIFRCEIPVVSAVGHEIDLTIADMVADFRALTPSEAAERVVPDRIELAKGLTGVGVRLGDLLRARLKSARHRLDEIGRRPVFQRPLEAVRLRERRLDELEQRLHQAWRRRAEMAKAAIALAAGRLESLSPLNVLARGYSLTRNDQGRLVRSIRDVKVGDAIDVTVSDGVIRAEVRP